MSLLESIVKGKEAKAPRIMLYGGEGIGKSTFGASAPNPVFVQTEDGLGEIDCHKFPLAKSLQDVHAALSALAEERHEFQTAVVDCRLAGRLIFDEVCKEFGVKNIEKADGGYARGYTHALTHWRRIVNALERLRDERGMAVILISHSKVEKFEDPESSAYDRYLPRLHKHACSLICEWVDAVLFAARRFRDRRRRTRASTRADHSRSSRGRRGASASSARRRTGLRREEQIRDFRLSCRSRGRRSWRRSEGVVKNGLDDATSLAMSTPERVVGYFAPVRTGTAARGRSSNNERSSNCPMKDRKVKK
jgi:hypothetical protein